MPSTSSFAKSPAPGADVARCLNLLYEELSQCGDARGPRAKEIQRDIIELLYRYLHRSLRPRMLQRNGRAVGEQATGNRFTVLLTDFFIRVMEGIRESGKFPDSMMQARTAAGLRRYVEQALVRLMIDHYRRRSGGFELSPALLRKAGAPEVIVTKLFLLEGKTFRTQQHLLQRVQEILTDDEFRSLKHIILNWVVRRGGKRVDVDFDQFVREREEFFAKHNPDLAYSGALGVLQEWSESDRADLQQHAAILQMCFVAGMKYSEIAAELGIAKSEYYRRYAAAIQRLREAMK